MHSMQSAPLKHSSIASMTADCQTTAWPAITEESVASPQVCAAAHTMVGAGATIAGLNRQPHHNCTANADVCGFLCLAPYFRYCEENHVSSTLEALPLESQLTDCSAHAYWCVDEQACKSLWLCVCTLLLLPLAFVKLLIQHLYLRTTTGRIQIGATQEYASFLNCSMCLHFSVAFVYVPTCLIGKPT